MDAATAGTDVPAANNAASVGEEGPVREDYVKSAAEFLVHPKSRNASMEERKKFLLGKGVRNKGM
jgi:hypothetical protein